MADQKSKTDQDLSQQLDALLSEIEQQEPGFAQAAGLGKETSEAVPAATATVTASQAPKAAEASGTAGAAAGNDVTSKKDQDDLDAQIQALLNSAKTLEIPASVRASAGAEAAGQTPGEVETESAREIKGTDDSRADAAAVAEAPKSAEAAAPADSGLMQQIDELLASEADKAVAGEFETVDDVLGDEQVAAPVAIPPAPTREVSATAQEAQASGQAGAEGAQTSGATAKDVAAELDQDLVAAAPTPEPEVEPQAAGKQDKTAAKTPAGKAQAKTEAEGEEDEQAVEEQAETLPLPEPVIRKSSLLRFCTAINAPVRKLSPPSRRIVGYVALLTLFNGSAFTIMALLRSVLGH